MFGLFYVLTWKFFSEAKRLKVPKSLNKNGAKAG